MAKAKTKSTEPVVTVGSHSVRTVYPDGRVEFETVWEELVNDVNAAIREYNENKNKAGSKKVKQAVEAVVVSSVPTS